MENFIEQFIDVIDTEEELTAETLLADVEEWDSLGLVSFVAMAKSVYGKQIPADEIRKAVKVADLFALVK